MDYKELVENAKVCCGDIKVEDCAERCKNPFDKRGEEVRWCRQWLIHDLHTAITDLLSRAEAAEAELEQKKGYYHQMVDALAAVDSRELEEAKEKLKAAEDRCKRLEEARENANEAAAKWEGMYHMALERAEKAERERDAAIKTLDRLGAKIEILYEIVEKKFGPIKTCEQIGQNEE